MPETGVQGELVARAQAAVADARWLDALDLASQALAANPHNTQAAVLVGTARQRLGTVSAAVAELRQITVVAIDMVSSTMIAARVGPEAMRQLMLELYECCAEAVSRYEGRVTKYGGDGVLAQFGYPVAHEDDARRAVLAAWALLESVGARAVSWERHYGEPIRVRIGIDSGLAAVGPLDTSPWSPEEIAGDPPNVATRVQSEADPMTIRVTDSTRGLIEGWFETEPIGVVELRNYPRPVGLHVVARPTEAETRLEARISGRPELVNRVGELGKLRAAWNAVADAEAGERRVVSIFGDPGIGKSRLVEHVAATAVAAGASHMTLACSSLHRHSPLRPLVRALSRFFRVFPHEGGSEAMWLDAIEWRLGQLPGRQLPSERAVPVYGWLLGIRSALDLQPEELRRESFDAVIDLLEAMAGTSMLVLCVEDIDAADPSTAELVQTLLARDPTSMFVILTSRGPLPWLDRADDVLELEALAPGHAAALVRSVGSTLDDAAVLRIVERSDGVPFFAEELARAAQEGGALSESVQLSGFLRGRVDELGPHFKRLVNEIAVAGEGIRMDLLQRVSGLSEESLEELVNELENRRVVVRAQGPVTGAVRLRHRLLRSVAYDSLLASDRALLHGRLANAMAKLPEGTIAPEERARHHKLAGDDASAAPLWLDAGRRAAAGGAYTEARELFSRCLGSLAELPEGPGRAGFELEAQLGLGVALSSVEGYTSPAARTAFERAAALAEELADGAPLIPALWGIWAYWLVLGEHSVATALAERCLRIGEQDRGDPSAGLFARAMSGYSQLYLGDFRRAREELEEAGYRLISVEPPPEIPHDPQIACVGALAVGLWFLGDRDAGREAARRAQEMCDAMDASARRTALTQCFVGSLHAWFRELDGDSAAALDLAEKVAVLAKERGYPTWLAAASLHRSIALCSLGRCEEGLPQLAALVQAWRSAGQDPKGRQLHPVLMTPYFAGRLAEIQLSTGEVHSAAAELDRILADTAANGEHFWDAELLRLRAIAAHSLGEGPERVREWQRAARRLADEQHAEALIARLDREEEQRP